MKAKSSSAITAINDPASHLLAIGRRVLSIEARALMSLQDSLGNSFVCAVQTILSSHGRVIVSGIGKSGHIARKIASTLASTGTPAYFVHPAEALHGDLGMIAQDDILIALSNSGHNEELLTLLPSLKRRGGKVIAITGDSQSPLARQADVVLEAKVAQEACPLNLAPTASTTAALALGDALAVALLDARGFNSEDFALTHPGGSLGRRLLTHVRDVMHTGAEIPQVQEDADVIAAMKEMSRGNLGMTAVTDAHGALVGIFTDGDLRRTLEKHGDVRGHPVHQVMTPQPHTITADHLAAAAVQYMERYRCTQLLVVDEANHVVGALNMQDLLRHQVV